MATTGTFLKPIFIAGTSYPVGAATIDDTLVSQLPRDTFVPAVEPVTGGEDDVKARRAAGFLDTGLADGKVPVWNATQKKYVPGIVASENSGSVAAADITDAGTAGIAVLQSETAAQGREALEVGLLIANDQTGDYVLAASDVTGSTEIRQNSATGVNLTINADVSGKLFTPVYGKQVGAGQVTFVAGSGVTLHIQGAKTKTAEQYAPWAALQVSANVWEICGGLS